MIFCRMDVTTSVSQKDLPYNTWVYTFDPTLVRLNVVTPLLFLVRGTDEWVGPEVRS